MVGWLVWLIRQLGRWLVGWLVGWVGLLVGWVGWWVGEWVGLLGWLDCLIEIILEHRTVFLDLGFGGNMAQRGCLVLEFKEKAVTKEGGIILA